MIFTKQFMVRMALSVICSSLIASFSVRIVRADCPDGASEFACGADDVVLHRFSDQQIQLEIERKIKIACDGDECTLMVTSNSGHSFSTSINVGYGNSNGVASGGSPVVFVGTGSSPNYGQGPFATVGARYVYSTCRQSIEVPEALYRVLQTYLLHLINEDGSTKKVFSPSENTMLMFWTTIQTNLKPCTAGN